METVDETTVLVCLSFDRGVVFVCPCERAVAETRTPSRCVGAVYPLLGERLYAFGKDSSLKFSRTALHASEVSFKHPQTGIRLNVASPLAKDMENFLNRY